MAEPRPSPLDILLLTMMRKWDVGDFDGAVALAKVAAPYIHPRASIAPKPQNVGAIEDADLHEFFERRALGAGTAELESE